MMLRTCAKAEVRGSAQLQLHLALLRSRALVHQQGLRWVASATKNLRLPVPLKIAECSRVQVPCENVESVSELAVLGFLHGITQWLQLSHRARYPGEHGQTHGSGIACTIPDDMISCTMELKAFK